VTGWIRAVQLVLLVNALPAFVVLSSAPGRTDDLFVWTVKPDASARLLAAMYGNAALLTLLTLGRKAWAEIRVAFVVITFFSFAATIVTFFHLDPFLAHPRYFFVYWLVNYFFLFLLTPIVFFCEERAHGGRLPVEAPLWRAPAALAGLACLACGIAMFVGPPHVNDVWPWPLTPLVARIIGVWLTALAAAFAWAVWDGDAVRSKPIVWQSLPTAALVGIAPLVHHGDLTGGGGHWVLFAALLAGLAVAPASALRARVPARPAGGPASSH
jgi:hypothetical protein